MRKVIRGCALLCALSTSVQPGVNFGSRQAAIEVTGGTFDFINNATLSKGTLRTVGAGSFTGDASEYLDCSKMSIQTKYDVASRAMRTDGKVYLNDGTLTLEDNDTLIMNGGTITQNVTVSGADATPSIIQGTGNFDAAITISDEKELVMRWNSILDKNITLTPTTDSTSSQLTLERDLTFANGYGPASAGGSGTAKVNFGGYKMTLGGISTTLGAAQTWDQARLELSGDTTIEVDVTLTGADAEIHGNGYKLTVSGGFLGSYGGTVSDVHIPSFDSGVFGGSGNWVLHNVILSDADEMLRVNDGRLNGGTADVFAGAARWNAATNIDLLKDLTLVDEWQFDATSYLNGNGHTLTFTDTTGTIDYNSAFHLTDITLANVSSTSFDNASSRELRMRNVIWHDGAQAGSVRITNSPMYDSSTYAIAVLPGSGAVGALFGENITWSVGASIDLLSNTTLTGTWTFSQKTAIKGDGHTFNVVGGTLNYDADLYLSDLVLADVDAAAFDNAGNQDLYLSNVTWVDDTSEGIVRITGNTEDTSVDAALVELATTNSGNLFSTAVNWKNGANIELLKGVTFNTGAAWAFTKSSVINGNGNILDLNSVSGTDPITVASGQTLTITDTVIKGWGNGDIVFAGATLKLSNVTIVLDANVTLASNEHITIDGPVRFVTGSYIFDGSAADTNNTLGGFTVWYDTLGTLGNTNVRLGSFGGTGRVVMMPLSTWSDISFDTNASHVQEPMWLSYDINVGSDLVYESLGRQITIDNSSAFTMKGNGRTWYMTPVPVSSATTVVNSELVTVSGSATNKVEVHDLIMDGWAQAHFSDTNNLLRYCTGTVIRLQADQSLSTTLNFSNTSNTGDAVVIDLNGYDFDMGSDDAELAVAATDATVTIKNGRIINLDDNSGSPKFTCGGASSTWIFQDVDLVLAANTTFSGNNITFKGDCTITGTGRTDDVTNPTTFLATFSDTDITIADGACLKVDKGIALELDGFNTNFDSSLTFGSANSTLHLDGAVLKVSGLSADTTFTHGTMRIDDRVTVIAGSRTLTLGGTGTHDELDLDLMPAASFEVVSGTVSYANAS